MNRVKSQLESKMTFARSVDILQSLKGQLGVVNLITNLITQKYFDKSLIMSSKK